MNLWLGLHIYYFSIIMSVLLKCIRYRHLSQNKIFNQTKKTANFIVPFQNSVLFVLKRNMSIEDTNLKQNFIALRILMLKEKWFEKEKIESTLNLIETKDDLNSDEVLLLLQCCNKIMECMPAERLEFGEYVWNYLSTCNVSWNIYHYNELLKIYLHNDKDFSPMDFIENMINKNVMPNQDTYESCIQYYCKKGNVNDANQLITMNHIFINKKIYNFLMWGYCQNGDLKTALEMFEKKEHFCNDAEMYTTLMLIYAKENKIDKIVETIQLCNLRSIPLSNESILNVLYELAVKKHVKDIRKLILCLKNQGEPISFNEAQILTKLVHIKCFGIVMHILSHINDGMISKLLLQYTVRNNTNIYIIECMCNFYETRNLCSEPLLWALFYSYSKNDENLCLSLLKVCKHHYTIKPHYFWPLFIKNAEMYNFQGILNLIEIMIKHFKISPCVDTINDYVLPFTYECLNTTREKLINVGINETVLNNAILLTLLNDNKIKPALTYMVQYPDCYMYKILQYKVRKCLLYTNQMQDFISISVKLMDTDPCTQTLTFVPIDKQLLDFLLEYPVHISFVEKIVDSLRKQDSKISKSHTYDLISSCIKENILIKYNMHYL